MFITALFQKHQRSSEQQEDKKNLKLFLLERWGCIQAGVLLFQTQFLTGVVLAFEWGEVLFKSGVEFKRKRYI